MMLHSITLKRSKYLFAMLLLTSMTFILLTPKAQGLEIDPITPLDAEEVIAEVQHDKNKEIIETVLYEEVDSYQEKKLAYLESDPVAYLQYKAELEGLHQYEIDTLNRIMYCESKYDPYAYNGSSGASGLFQFLYTSWQAWGNGGNVFDTSDNINAALTYYQAAGTAPWVCK